MARASTLATYMMEFTGRQRRVALSRFSSKVAAEAGRAGPLVVQPQGLHLHSGRKTLL